MAKNNVDILSIFPYGNPPERYRDAFSRIVVQWCVPLSRIPTLRRLFFGLIYIYIYYIYTIYIYICILYIYVYYIYICILYIYHDISSKKTQIVHQNISLRIRCSTRCSYWNQNQVALGNGQNVQPNIEMSDVHLAGARDHGTSGTFFLGFQWDSMDFSGV
jgi:hypothetical protein